MNRKEPPNIKDACEDEEVVSLGMLQLIYHGFHVFSIISRVNVNVLTM